ncbi:Right origin-binding protein [Serratia fonticola AU-AP2C]|nr:Right origin-binding protein [Serratia fonticola AU-AP2C]
MTTFSYFYDLMCWIEKNLINEKLHINDISKKSGYTKWHLQRIFKKQTGLTLAKYVKQRRMTKSAMALSFTNMPISEISFTYGFDSQQNFTRVFKKYFGVTPLVYRRLPNLKTEKFLAGPEGYVGTQPLSVTIPVRKSQKIVTLKSHENICSEFSDGGRNFIEGILCGLIKENKNNKECIYISYEHAVFHRFSSFRISEVAMEHCLTEFFCITSHDYPSEICYVKVGFEGSPSEVFDFFRWIYYSYLPSKLLNKIKLPDMQVIDLNKSCLSLVSCDFFFPVENCFVKINHPNKVVHG